MTALNLTELYENEVFRIRYNKEVALLELTFLQHPDTDHFRHGYNLAFDAALYKDVKYWLTDATQIKAMEPENQLWLKDKMSLLLKSGQLRRFAIVMAPECFVMTNPNQVYQKQNQSSEGSTFSPIKVHFDKEAARNWLLSTDNITIA